MAEGYLKRRLKELGKEILVESTGTGTISGFKPSQEAIEAMKEIGIDVSGYESSVLTREAVDKADVILVMAPMHKEAIVEMAPIAKDKIFYLREFAKEGSLNKFIPDPIGKPIEFYRKILDVIKQSLEGFLKWLQN
ncbi:MAG: hypothetical protein KAU58_06395 [Candidatus Omnitrophica bacterium]|nr:hypothetical protein [Candidatus Omnitrophota bacterium]